MVTGQPSGSGMAQAIPITIGTIVAGQNSIINSSVPFLVPGESCTRNVDVLLCLDCNVTTNCYVCRIGLSCLSVQVNSVAKLNVRS